MPNLLPSGTSEEGWTLFEIILRAEQFCGRIESRARNKLKKAEEEEVRLKIGQCRNLLAELHKAYDEDNLKLENVCVKNQFRLLIMALLWVTFNARSLIDHKLFRMLVVIESSFTYLLIVRTSPGR